MSRMALTHFSILVPLNCLCASGREHEDQNTRKKKKKNQKAKRVQRSSSQNYCLRPQNFYGTQENKTVKQ